MNKLFYTLGLTALLCGCGAHFGDEVTLQDFMNSDNKKTGRQEMSYSSQDINTEDVSVQVSENGYAQGIDALPQVSDEEIQEQQFFDFSQANITPEVYGIAARRATLRMLDSSSALYFGQERIPLIYISDVVKLNDQMPDGFYFARKATRDIIAGSRNFMVTDNPDEADYILKISVDALPTEYEGMPEIDYQLALTDKEGNEVQRWSASIKQVVDGDRSWW